MCAWFGVMMLAQLLAVTADAATSIVGSRTSLTGEQKQWHTVTLTFSGPASSESDNVNPFLDYRLNVAFTHL
ncbi:MAG: DUF5060 domain-containing protein [Opitutus sp.]